MSDLRFYQSFRRAISWGRWCGLPLPWPGEAVLPKSLVAYHLFLYIYACYKFVCTGYSMVHIEQVEIRIYLLAAFAYFVMNLFIPFFYLRQGQEFLKLIQNTDRLTKIFLSSGLLHNGNFEKRSSAAKWDNFAKFMVVATFFSPMMFSVSVPFMDYLNGEYRSKTAVPAQCPIELEIQQIPGVFEIIVIQQGLAYTIPSVQKFATEIVMLGLFNIQSGLFQFLSEALDEINAELINSSEANNLKENSIKKFYIWMSLHQEAVKHFENVISLFSPMIVIFYFVTIVTIAGSMLYMMDAYSSNIIQTLFGGGYMGMLMFSLFLQCQAADDAVEAAQNVAASVYNLPWHMLDKKMKKYINFIMMVSTKPIFVDAYKSPVFRLSKEAYQQVFLNTVSSYMAFRKIKDLQHEDNDAV